MLCAPFTTTGNESKQLFDALTFEEGGREKDGNGENIFLFCPQKGTVIVSFHPEVLWKADKERGVVMRRRRWVDGSDVTPFCKCLFLWLTFTVGR